MNLTATVFVKNLLKTDSVLVFGNPTHYTDEDLFILNTDFDIPKRDFDIGYIDNSSNEFIQKFIELM